MGTPTLVTGTAAESAAAAATAGFLGWTPMSDWNPYMASNGRDGTAATAYVTLTAYAAGKTVTDAGLTYVVRTAVGSGNATAPATNTAFVTVDNHRGIAETTSPTTRRLQFYR